MDQISSVFKNTLNSNNQIRNEAEGVLKKIIFDKQTLELFFQYISTNTISMDLRKSASVFLMKYLKDYWFDDSEAAMLSPDKIIKEDAKQSFKTNILQLLLMADPQLIPIVKQMINCIIELGGGYMVIWPELMTKLAEILKQKNYTFSTEVYHLIQKMIKRYHIESKSAPLFKEIKNTMSEICGILTEDGLRFSKYLNESKLTDDSLPCLLLLKRILQIFYSLNYQDFPEFFEDHLKEWIEILSNCILFPCDSPTLYDKIIKVKSTTMKCVNLYFTNYFDDILDFAAPFYPNVWKLIFIIKKEDQYGSLVKELLDFYRSCFEYRRIKDINQNDINILISNIILPNIKMTSKEMEEFDDNPVNFLKVELEEADMDSNKYHAINLLKKLIIIYPNMPNDFINPMIQKMLNDYYANPNKCWNDKIVAINLIFAVYIKTFAQRIGVTEMNSNLSFDLTTLISEVFTKEFQAGNTPIAAKVYSMKFLTTFRLQIPTQFLGNVIDLLINILNNSDQVCQSACLLTLEKILYMKNIHTQESLTKQAVNNQTTFSNLVSSLVKFITTDTNIFAIRCFYRTIFLTDEQYYNNILESLTKTMNEILKSIIIKSQQDEFNFYFFETCALILKKLSLINISMVTFFQTALQDNLGTVLTNSVTDLMGYTFQLFGYYLYISNDQNEYYSKLLKSILYDSNSWTLNMKYMFNPFISFIKASFIRKKEFFNQSNSIEQIFKIVDILLNLKCYPQMFDLLDHLINFLDPMQLINSFNGLLVKCITILQLNKTNNFIAYRDFGKEVLIFISKLIIKINPDNTFNMINQIANANGFAFLNELFELFSYIENIKQKKISLWAFCLLISHFCKSIPFDIIKQITIKLIQAIQNFYKFNFGLLRNRNENQDISYAAHNYNKLFNAEIRSEIAEYKNLYEVDEKQTFFNAMSSIQEKMKGNLVTAIFDQLNNREKDYVKTNAEKFNFSLNIQTS